ncbi:ferric reductase [Pilimelia anulata]|uniref:Ferric reductase n=1 Tax=Pilimelia anulata TaxID=53371 RepID=A0A8J3B607_9ACTN|nr:ferric reductase-like transmembrane domain-containing protein [Pilimelia anulata]GGJ90650.1 ferric reductase [Pilimelia anulata]
MASALPRPFPLLPTRGAHRWAADRHAPPADRAVGDRLLVALAFWVLLAGTVALWAFRTPAASLAVPGVQLIQLGKVVGLVAGYLMLAQVTLVSRLGWLERSVGAAGLVRWHRYLGPAVLAAVVAHVTLLSLGFANRRGQPLLPVMWGTMTGTPELVQATIAAGLLVLAALLAVRSVRRRMRYEHWRLLHGITYAVLLLGIAHQFTEGPDLAEPVARTYWILLYAAVGAALLWGRLLGPVLFNLRHRFVVTALVRESADVYSIYLAARHHRKLRIEPGQHLTWRFMTPLLWGQAHPFSLSAAPREGELRLTVHTGGDYTRLLRTLRPHTPVIATNPSGTFTARWRTRGKALLIAGGSGIAPVRALLDTLPADVVVIYRAHGPDELPLADELDAMAARRQLRVHYVVGDRYDAGPRAALSPAGLAAMVPDIAERDVYLCGPPGLLGMLHSQLRRLSVPRRQIHVDAFEL